MTEDEARIVAKVAAGCVRAGRSHLGLIMRYGRLFTPGTDAGGGEETDPPLDPGTDIVLAYGRDIPTRVRDWALAAESAGGGDPVAPAWVLDELLTFPV